MHHPTDRITHTTAFVTPVVEHWLEREIAQWVLKGNVGFILKNVLTRTRARCSSVVRAVAHGGPIELFLVPASAPRLV